MNASLKKSVLLSASLIMALVALSSCGKSKDLKSTPPTPTVQPTQLPPAPINQVPPPAQLQPLQPNQPNLNNQTIPQGPALPQRPPTAPHSTTPFIDQPIPPPQSSPGPGLNPGGPISAVPPQLEKLKLKAYEINFQGQVAVRTGGVSGDLFYTSVGDDGLMEEFKSYNSKVSADQQVMNSNLAKAITNAKLTRVSSVGDMAINLSINEFGTLQTYRLSATADGEKMKLAISSKGTTGEMNFQGGFLKCLDNDGSCDTAYAKIKMAGGYTRIIFRNSFAEQFYLTQENVSNNAAFAVWSRYAINAASAQGSSDRIEAMQLSSFEIINGRAATGAAITTADSEIVGLSIPMVVSAKDSVVSATATKVSDISKNYDLAGAGASNLSQKINSVKIVNNNGRGQFKLQLQFGTESNPASIWIVVSRVQKEIMTLDEIRSFESKIKAF